MKWWVCVSDSSLYLKHIYMISFLCLKDIIMIFQLASKLFFKMRKDVNSHRIQMHQKSLLLFKAYHQNICYKLLLGLGLLWTTFFISHGLNPCFRATGCSQEKSPLSPWLTFSFNQSIYFMSSYKCGHCLGAPLY